MPGDHPDGQPHPARLPARRDARGCAAARSRRSTTPATARRSARCWSTSRRCATCSPTWRSSPRRRRSRRCASRAAYDEPEEAAFRRFATAVMKYWVCKRAPGHAAEALECLGGNGFVEDSGMPLLYRDAPLELDLGGLGQRRRARRAARDGQGARGAAGVPGGVRARRRAPTPGSTRTSQRVRERAAAVFAGEDPAVRGAAGGRGPGARAPGLAARPPRAAGGRRRVLRDAGSAGEGGRVYGTLPAGVDAGAIIERALPGLSDGRRPLRGHRPDRAADPEPARARQRDHARRCSTSSSECVERADLDPDVHVLLLAGAGKGFCGGYDLVESAEGQGRRRRRPTRRGSPARRSTRSVMTANHDPGADVGPDGRLRDDEPQRPRVHVAVPLLPSRWSARCTGSASPAAPTWRCARTCW